MMPKQHEKIYIGENKKAEIKKRRRDSRCLNLRGDDDNDPNYNAAAAVMPCFLPISHCLDYF